MMKTKNPPVNRATPAALRRLVRRLKNVSELMRYIGADMEYYGGFGELGQHGREMLGAAALAKSWCEPIERQAQYLDALKKSKPALMRKVKRILKN